MGVGKCQQQLRILDLGLGEIAEAAVKVNVLHCAGYNGLMSEQRDVTVHLPRLLWTHLERVADECGITLSQLTSQALMRLVEGDAVYLAARKRAMERLRNASSLTLDGNITWTRDDLHER
jgi:hypothetical protein